ncbi:hypothetical protein BJX99DRAFT_272820 [Aspergillus californicus]
MDPASLALAVVGILHICHEYGKHLVSLCHAYKNYDAGLDEIILAIQNAWLKMDVQLKALTTLWDKLQPQLQALYHDALTRLQVKLVAAYGSFKVTHGKSDVALHVRQKLKVVYLKRQLTQTVADLEEWQRRFDPSWYLITRIASPGVDEGLKVQNARGAKGQPDSPSIRLAQMRESMKQISEQAVAPSESVFKDASVLIDDMSRIKGTDAYLSKYRDSSRCVLLDRANPVDQTSITTARVNMRDLARLLLHIDPMTFNLLRCDGVIELPTDQGNQFHLLFEIPAGLSSPQTLRQLLRDSSKCSLSHRFQQAKQLARSVMFVHAAGFVHKNIRPETILIFQHPTNKLSPSFLIGFERIRKAEGRTDKSGDIQWERNLYRHPFRQGLQPEAIFEMRHDIYSLGVCLLEIGLWKSFVCSEEDGESPAPWSGLNISTAMTDKDARRAAGGIKSGLVALCKDSLPSLVGERYTDVVVACLCCLDDSADNSFRDEKSMQDKDGIIVGVRYIENVLLKLEELFV